MNGMFRFKANNGKNDVSLCIFFKGLTGRVVVDGKKVSCLGKNLKIVESLTDNDYQKVFTVNQGKGIISVELNGGLFSVESEKDVLREFSKTHIAHFEGVNN